MSSIWSKAVDGAFTGGKWGKYAGAAAGVVAALTVASPTAAFDMFFLGPIGAAAVLGAGGFLAGMAAGAAIGFVVGAGVEAVKKAFGPSEAQDQAKFAGKGRDPVVAEMSRSQSLNRGMEQENQPSYSYRERVRESRNKDTSKYRGL